MLKQLIIVAGGKGIRMQQDIPKQFIVLKGKTILEHTISAFEALVALDNMVVVLPENEQNRWQEIVYGQPYERIKIATGGKTRFDSVKSGLKAIKREGVVAIHDAVRPFVDKEVISAAFEKAEKCGAAIPTSSVTSSIRRVFEGISRAENRENFVEVQTPQCFQTELLKEAYEQAKNLPYTDDASVVEAHGKKIYLTEGNVENIKITTPFDLKVAEMLLND